MKKIILVAFSALFLSSCSWFHKRHTIVFTHNTNGWIEDCGCALGTHYGGLHKRTSVFRSVSEADESALFFDAGDMLSTDARNPERDKFVIRMMKFLHYDAIGVGDQEFIHGKNFYKTNTKYLPMISSNVVDAGLSAKVLKRNDEQIAVLSLLNPYMLGFLPDSIQKQVEVLDPDLILETLFKQFGDKKIENIVLLSNMGWDDDKKLAEKYPQLSLIISGHDQSPKDSMIVVNGTPIVQNGPDGERVSILEGYFSGGKFEVMHFNRIILDEKILPDSLVYSEIQRFKSEQDTLKQKTENK